MKKVILIIALFVIAVFAIAGCTGTNDTSSSGNNSAAAVDSSSRITDLASEGVNVADQAADESHQAYEAALAGDLAGACAHAPSLRASVARLTNITVQLDGLGADTTTLHSLLPKLQSGMRSVRSVCG